MLFGDGECFNGVCFGDGLMDPLESLVEGTIFIQEF